MQTKRILPLDAADIESRKRQQARERSRKRRQRRREAEPQAVEHSRTAGPGGATGTASRRRVRLTVASRLADCRDRAHAHVCCLTVCQAVVDAAGASGVVMAVGVLGQQGKGVAFPVMVHFLAQGTGRGGITGAMGDVCREAIKVALVWAGTEAGSGSQQTASLVGRSFALLAAGHHGAVSVVSG